MVGTQPDEVGVQVKALIAGVLAVVALGVGTDPVVPDDAPPPSANLDEVGVEIEVVSADGHQATPTFASTPNGPKYQIGRAHV